MINSRILIIEDDESIRQVLKEYLDQLGFQVITAADGLEGLDLIKQQGYDLIVSDIRIPYVSGIGLIKIAREINPNIPIISITSFGEPSEKTAREEATTVIAKPFDLEELSNKIKELLTEN
ncbi:MAG: response regulator [Desulfohalobiaceae bacterium]|nr:response regulator [Desulfohalobiaceae bacterium]